MESVSRRVENSSGMPRDALVAAVRSTLNIAATGQSLFASQLAMLNSWDRAGGEVRWMCSFDTTEHDIDAAFTRLVEQGADMLLVANDPFFTSRRDQIVALVVRLGLPASFSGREFVDAGGLSSYGPNLTGVYHLAGIYVGKVLKGAKPADLPVQQPTKFDLAINLKAAKALHLTISADVLAIADEVIE